MNFSDIKLDPKKLECFYNAVMYKTIRAAAEKLNLEPSSVSRQITSLEKTLSVTLIERGRHGVKPTQAGALLQEYYKNQNAQLESFHSTLDDLKNLRRGNLTLGVGEGFVGDLMSPALNIFSQQYPNIKLNIETGNTNAIIENIINDSAHLGLAYNLGNFEKITSLKQVKQPTMLLVAPTHPLASEQEPIALSRLSNLPTAVLNLGSGVRQTLSDATQFKEYEPNNLVQTNSIAVLKNFVRANMGISFLPAFVVIKELQEGAMVAKKLQDDVFNSGEAHLFTRSGRELPLAGKALANILIKQMSCFSH